MSKLYIENIKECSYDLTSTIRFHTSSYHGFSIADVCREMENHYSREEIEEVVALAILCSNHTYSDQLLEWANKNTSIANEMNGYVPLSCLDASMLASMVEYLQTMDEDKVSKYHPSRWFSQIVH